MVNIGTFGIVIRYKDMFSHYALEINFENRIIKFIKRDPFNNDKILLNEDNP